MNAVKLIFHSGPLLGRNLQFQGNATIGRDPSNAIVLNDPRVSSRHGEIFYEHEKIFLKDNHSTNGTTVNDLPIEVTELHDGDTIIIGASQIEAQLTPMPVGEPAPATSEPEPAACVVQPATTPPDQSPEIFAPPAILVPSTAPPLTDDSSPAPLACEPAPLDSKPAPPVGAPAPANRPAIIPPDSKTLNQRRSGKTRKLKIVIAAACGLTFLLGVGIGLRYGLPSNPGKEAPKTKPVKTANNHKPKAEPTWNDLARTFKPEGNKDLQAKQRIAFLEKLIRRFPKDQPNILSAYLDLARQYETLKNPKSAARYYEQFLAQTDQADQRRVNCMSQLILALTFAGEPGKAGAAFERFHSEQPVEAVAAAEKICAEACATGHPEQIVELVSAVQACLLRHAEAEPKSGEWNSLRALDRYERRARTALWLNAVKENTSWDHNDEQTLLVGILGGMRSMDCLVKATMTNERLIGEGVDVSGRFEDHSFIMACQYPCKADQLLSWYGKTGFEEYRATAAGFIRKLHKLYTSTKDVSGKNWLPLGNFVDANGKAWSYFDAPKLDRNLDVFPWDQSRSRQNTHHDFMDAWGLGMWELSKSAALLAPADRQTLVELLKGLLDFYHRSYMLKDEGGVYYWRTDAFCPLTPPEKIPAPDWNFLGVDVIHAVLALHELGEDTRPWHESLKKFAAWYMQERAGHNESHLIEHTDMRAFDLAEFLDKVCKDATLKKWLKANLPALYKTRRKDVSLVIQGGTLIYSTLPVMEVMARIDPEQYRKMWRDLMSDHITPHGLFQDGEYPTINISQAEAILDSTLRAWGQGVLSTAECRKGVEQLFLMWGNPRCYRDMEDWVVESFPYQRNKRSWQAIPYAGYPENVRPEAYYNGLPQAYTITRYFAAGDFKLLQTFEKACLNCLIQYTAPGGQLTERIRYGRMSTFNILDTRNQVETKAMEKDGGLVLAVECVMPDAPAGAPCVGVVKVTDIYYREESWRKPTGYQVARIIHEGESLPFKIYGLYGYAAPPAVGSGDRDNVKAGFLLRAGKAGRKEKVQIEFERIP